jgi:ATP-dependent protease HslVU (ClpYQ) peptidase subunit
MTTIAWDGMVLAADTQGVFGEMVRVTSHKLFRLSNGSIIGASGSVQDTLLAVKWLNEGGKKPELDDFAALLITVDGACFRVETKLMLQPIHEVFVACGTGRDFALAAMALGETSREAVMLAICYDIWSGGDVETLSLLGPESST